jgi:hypothetical protein
MALTRLISGEMETIMKQHSEDGMLPTALGASTPAPEPLAKGGVRGALARAILEQHCKDGTHPALQAPASTTRPQRKTEEDVTHPPVGIARKLIAGAVIERATPRAAARVVRNRKIAAKSLATIKARLTTSEAKHIALLKRDAALQQQLTQLLGSIDEP